MSSMTVLALFKTSGEAEAAVRALQAAHFESARLGIVHGGDADVPRFGRNAFFGVLGGTLGCALLGMVVGIFAAGIVPGIAPWLAGGWFAVFMLALGAGATGALAGLLISQSVARQGSLYYEEEVAGGRTLVSVHADPDRAEEARRILMAEGGFDAAPIDTPTTKAS
jgi:predicted membrane protein